MKSFGAMKYVNVKWKYIHVKGETMGKREMLYILLHLQHFSLFYEESVSNFYLLLLFFIVH